MNQIIQIYREQIKQYQASNCLNDRESYAIYYIYRPLSFFFSSVLIRTGFTANQVTIFRFFCFIGLVTPLCFAKNINTIYVIMALLFVCEILDFADGNIARYRKTSSLFGKFIDGFFDIFNVLIFLAIPFVSRNQGANYFPFEIELIMANILVITTLMYYFFDLRLNLYLKLVRKTKQLDSNQSSNGQSRDKVKYIKKIMDTIDGAFIPVIIMFTILWGASPVLILYFIFKPIYSLLRIIFYMKKYKSELVG